MLAGYLIRLGHFNDGCIARELTLRGETISTSTVFRMRQDLELPPARSRPLSLEERNNAVRRALKAIDRKRAEIRSRD